MTATLRPLCFLRKIEWFLPFAGLCFPSGTWGLLKDQEVEPGRSRAITFALAGAPHCLLSPCKPAQAWGSLCSSLRLSEVLNQPRKVLRILLLFSSSPRPVPRLLKSPEQKLSHLCFSPSALGYPFWRARSRGTTGMKRRTASLTAGLTWHRWC